MEEYSTAKPSRTSNNYPKWVKWRRMRAEAFVLATNVDVQLGLEQAPLEEHVFVW